MGLRQLSSGVTNVCLVRYFTLLVIQTSISKSHFMISKCGLMDFCSQLPLQLQVLELKYPCLLKVCTQPTIGTQNSIAIFHAVCFIPFSMLSHCPLCGGQKQNELVPTTSMRTVVTLQGSLCCFCHNGLNCYFYLI